jgi:hypothetical protein
MIDWISQNSDMLQVVLNAMMVVIWIVYLQIFLVSFRRQQRSEILINMGAGSDLSARCFVSNLSLEPVYLYDLFVELTTKDGTYEAVITDRAEMTHERPSRSIGTNQGPLSSGDVIDVGSFNDLLKRASQTHEGVAITNITHITITALAQTSSNPQVVGASRQYRLRKCDGMIDVSPTRITAKQIRSWWGRRQLRVKLEQRLQQV